MNTKLLHFTKLHSYLITQLSCFYCFWDNSPQNKENRILRIALVGKQRKEFGDNVRYVRVGNCLNFGKDKHTENLIWYAYRIACGEHFLPS